MKRINKIIATLILPALMLTIGSCSEEDYNEKYTDPNKVTKLLMDKLMVGQFVKENSVMTQGYDRYFNTDSQWLGRYSQTFGFYVGGTMWHNGYGVDGYYNNFYTALGNHKKLEAMYNELADAEKPSYEAYYLAAKVHIYCYLMALLDIYGDVPWSSAGAVAVTGNFANSNAHFDKSADLYKMVINDLKEIGIKFGTVSKPKDFTATQDFVNNADFNKWQMYANSLRLRAAVRVASNGPLTDTGRAAIKEILENPTTYPVVRDNEKNIQLKCLGNDPVGRAGGGLTDWKSTQLASGAVIRNMLSDYNTATYSGTYRDGIDDPRLPLLYIMATPTAGKQVGDLSNPLNEAATVYRGTDPTMTDAKLSEYDQGVSLSLVRTNSFFHENINYDHQIYSAAETWFIAAEAYHNNWANGDAKAAFKEGVRQSIKMLYKYHKIKEKQDADGLTDQRSYVLNPDEPSDAWIDNFADKRWDTKINGSAYDAANPRLDAIITQKWLSFNILYVREAWNDIRRTGYPSDLVFPQVSDSQIPNVPNRWRYPSGERDFNKNFSEVSTQDNYSTKLFWAK